MRSGPILYFLSLLSLSSPTVLAQQRIELVDDTSRDELALYAQTLGTTKRAFPREFRFPDDVKGGKVFGVDASHYQGDVDWRKVSERSVRFAFVKASEGSQRYDGFFERNWRALGDLVEGPSSMRRGAYHFMTANDSAAAQAKNYLNTVGKFRPEDLPPCVDVEWNFFRRDGQWVLDGNGNKLDQWASLSSAEIVTRLKSWLSEVETATGKRPVIYTNASWWNARVGKSNDLDSYKLWIADYTSKSLGREAPVVPGKLSWAFWQLTDKGVVKGAGLTKGLDTTVLRGDDTELTGLFEKK
jgi:lysozyme